MPDVPGGAPGAQKPKPLNLALQGGGSHGAFTWGVLDLLLEDGGFDLRGVSGTSAGAVNAVALAHGFAQAAQQHKDPVEARAAGAALARESLRRVWEGVGAMGSLMFGVPLRNPMSSWVGKWLSPYQTNPMGMNPLRSLLERELDFDAIGQLARPEVYVCATNVRTGRGELFAGKNLSVDAVMASACLPLLFQAVEIKGQYYWDGGYSGNPALYPLFQQSGCADILLVQINPIEHKALPSSAQDIHDRMNEVTFNASLLAELRAIDFVRRLLAEGRLDTKRYKSVRLHRIDGGTPLAGFGAASKTRSDLAFIRQLFDLGRTHGQHWLQQHRSDVGVRPTLHLEEDT
ncbi:MAG: patatin-like phospholipase family protein [Acidovorax sp.]